MWWFVVSICFGIWAIIDAKKRRVESMLLPGLTFILGPIVLPVYMAKRNLKENEIREGGLGWNILRNFALFWTIMCFVAGIFTIIAASNVETVNEFESGAAIIGAGFGIITLIVLWFVITVGSLVLGMFLKKSSIIEKGPTGALINSEEADYRLSDIAGHVSKVAKKGINKVKDELKQRQKL